MSLQAAVQVVARRMREGDAAPLAKMYDTFAPLGGAMGLPPRDAEQRAEWLAKLRVGINLVAFADGVLAGHLALMPTLREAEMVCFVHQDHRRQGVGMELASKAVEIARAEGLSAVWVLIDNANIPARRGLAKFGFHIDWQDRVESKWVYPIGPE